MSNTSLADSYLKLSGLDSALSKSASDYAAVQLQRLGVNFLKNSSDIFQSSLSAISQLASDITVTPELQKTLDSLISSIGSSVSPAIISAGKSAVKEILAARTEVQSEPDSDAEYVIIDNSIVSDFNNATDTFPVDSKHSKITFDKFLNLLNTVIAIIALVISLRPSTTEQEQLALQRAEVKILSEILENTKASNATISEQLDALKETVDTLQKEISEFENKKSEN